MESGKPYAIRTLLNETIKALLPSRTVREATSLRCLG